MYGNSKTSLQRNTDIFTHVYLFQCFLKICPKTFILVTYTFLHKINLRACGSFVWNPKHRARRIECVLPPFIRQGLNVDYSSNIWFSHWNRILDWNLAVKKAGLIALHLSLSLCVVHIIFLNFLQCFRQIMINQNKRLGATFSWPKYSL